MICNQLYEEKRNTKNNVDESRMHQAMLDLGLGYPGSCMKLVFVTSADSIYYYTKEEVW